jgi:integrase
VGEPEYHNNIDHRDCKTLLERADLRSEDKDKRFTFYSLRRVCATLPRLKNVNPKTVQEMLGQVTITQTMDTYSHVLPSTGDLAASAPWLLWLSKSQP